MDSRPGLRGAPRRPPWIILAFENEKPAAEILTHLVEDLGRNDPSNRLRITIVRGISKAHPSYYRIVIGSNIDPERIKKYAAMMMRIQEMNPKSDINLRTFLRAYTAIGRDRK